MQTKNCKIKVSICIPAFNQIHLLKRTYDSILIQDYEDYELIVTDDSNTDEVKDFTDGYSLKFNNKLKYYKNKIQLGSPENWNEGIRKSTGEYVKILHHDDWFTEPDSLRRLVNLLDQNPKATIGFVSTKNIDTATGRLRFINSPEQSWIEIIGNVPEMLIFNNFIGPPSSTIFRINEPNFKFDTNLIWVVDLDGYVRLLKSKNAQLVFDPTIAIGIGLSDLQTTRKCESSKQINLFEFFYFLKKWKINDVKVNDFIEFKTEHLLEQFSVKNADDLRALGITWRLPKNVHSLTGASKKNIHKNL